MFDVYFVEAELSTKTMHDWMATSIGMAAILSSTSLFIAIALAANYKQDEKNKNIILVIWPYARDAMKALRNTYRGIQSTLMLITLLDIKDLHHLIVPISLTLGAVVVMNRIWLRAITTQRAIMIEDNKQLLKEISAMKELTSTQIAEFSKRMHCQSKHLNRALLFSSIFTSMVEGLNPYIGTLALGALTPQMLSLITAFCCVYFFATISTKIHRELKVQGRALAVQNEIIAKLKNESRR